MPLHNMEIFSCYLIGEDHLVLECADILLFHGHLIYGIISPLAAAEDWAVKNKIDYFNSVRSAKRILATRPFDYLFSMVNSTILSSSLLSYAQKLSINYHNAPLPLYAGVHAPAWAILNAEQTHGVTWHIMTDVIDAGDILKQVTIEIDVHETGLSLNLKCYKQAITAFSELINELASHTYQRLPQDLTRRTYYDFHQKPIGNGWIAWDDTAEIIDRTCRALNLGHQYPNRLSVPKFKIGDHVFIIDKFHILDERSTEPPGTLVEITANHWRIATKTNTVLLEQISTLNSKICIFEEIVKIYDMWEGYRFSIPTEQQLNEYTNTSIAYAKWEPFWAQELIQFKPACLPFLTSIASIPKDTLVTYELNIPDSLCRSVTSRVQQPNEISTIHITILLIYLYRFNNKETLGVNFSCSHMNKLPVNILAFMAHTVPFCIDLNDDLTFDEVLQKVAQKRSILEQRSFYAQDIFHRYPELSSHGALTSTITIVIGDDSHQITHSETSIIFSISTDGLNICWHASAHLLKTKPYLAFILENSLNHIRELIKSISNDTKNTISTVPFLTSKERQQILVEWNQTTTVNFSIVVA